MFAKLPRGWKVDYRDVWKWASKFPTPGRYTFSTADTAAVLLNARGEIVSVIVPQGVGQYECDAHTVQVYSTEAEFLRDYAWERNSPINWG